MVILGISSGIFTPYLAYQYIFLQCWKFKRESITVSKHTICIFVVILISIHIYNFYKLFAIACDIIANTCLYNNTYHNTKETLELCW